MMFKASQQRFLAALLVLSLMSMACYRTYTAPTEDTGPIGSIVYVSDESGNFEIYLMNVNRPAQMRLTDDTAEESSPFYFSPDHFGFVSDQSGKYAIYTMTLDGLEQELWKQNDEQSLFAPSISTEREKVAYVVQYNEKSAALFWADLDGNNEEKLTNITGREWDPSWSPDGRKLAFSSEDKSDWEISIVNVDDGGIIQLTDNSFYDGRPRWSPDGSQILFESDRDGDWEIYVMDEDGTNIRAVTRNGTGDWGASWSPDGKWIVYTANHDGDDEIYIIDVHGKNQRKLTSNTALDRFPAWVP